MNLFQKIFDERFLDRRRRSSSVAGIVVGVLALVVAEWRLLVEHVWSWDLIAVGVGFVAIKLSMMAYYLITD